MDIIILDLEWNGSYSRRLKGYINEIIEFGAVKCSGALEVKDTFACFVKPQVGKRISSTISSLTSITDENLVDGITFMQAVSRFRKWAGDALILTWGTSDILTLIENCRYFGAGDKIPFLHSYCDLQRYTQDRLRLNPAEQVGLSKAAELLELDVSGMDHHRALDDSLMTLKILRKLYDKQALLPYIDECDEEFYRRITFKTTYICDLSSPLVTRSHLLFSCPKCGSGSERKTRWMLKNKGFRAEFRCKCCGHPFAGRLLIKQKYEGLLVNKKTFPIAEIETPRKVSPCVLKSMRLEVSEGVGILRFPAFDGLGVNHAFTTRAGGVSGARTGNGEEAMGGPEFASMNLGFGRGDAKETVEENYRIFCRAAGFDSESLVAGAQDHHCNIRRVGVQQRGLGIWREKDMESVDGLCTDEQGVTLVVYCADCVPLYFVDEKHHAIGLAHAGWRGTVMGMARAMAEKMATEFGTDPLDLRVAIGPSLCADCFEVDAPVAEEFQKLPHWERFVTDRGDGKFQVDLWACNREFLLDAGVPAEQISVGGVCTMCESDLLFSHRKTKGRRGSNCAMLALL